MLVFSPSSRIRPEGEKGETQREGFFNLRRAFSIKLKSKRPLLLAMLPTPGEVTFGCFFLFLFLLLPLQKQRRKGKPKGCFFPTPPKEGEKGRGWERQPKGVFNAGLPRCFSLCATNLFLKPRFSPSTPLRAFSTATPLVVVASFC